MIHYIYSVYITYYFVVFILFPIFAFVNTFTNFTIMASNPKTRAMTLKNETVELLQTVKSCFQLGRKKSITYDELIVTLVRKGLVVVDPKVARLLELTIEAEEDQESDQDVASGEVEQ